MYLFVVTPVGSSSRLQKNEKLYGIHKKLDYFYCYEPSETLSVLPSVEWSK